MESARSIALIGLPGSGKSTSGRVLAERLGWPFLDLDTAIEAEAGLTVAAIFEREGEPAFRRRESGMLRRVSAGPTSVVACGGGIVLDPANREILAQHFVAVWLQVEPREAARRLAGETDARPMLRGGAVEGRLEALLGERRALYEEAATLEVRTDGLGLDAVVAPVMSYLAGAR